MAIWVLLAIVAGWCLGAVGLGLVLCRAICWARGTDPADETTPSSRPTGSRVRPAVALPAPRPSALVLDLSARDEPAAATTGESPSRTIGA